MLPPLPPLLVVRDAHALAVQAPSLRRVGCGAGDERRARRAVCIGEGATGHMQWGRPGGIVRGPSGEGLRGWLAGSIDLGERGEQGVHGSAPRVPHALTHGHGRMRTRATPHMHGCGTNNRRLRSNKHRASVLLGYSVQLRRMLRAQATLGDDYAAYSRTVYVPCACKRGV